MLVALLGLCSAVLSSSSSSPLLEFSLEDQFGRTHRAEELRGRVVVLIGADRKGSASNGAWSGALRERLGTQDEGVVFVGVADLRGVPFFMKSMIRKRFSQRPDEWSLLDWEGEIPGRFEFARGQSNVLVFDAGGRLLGRAAGSSPDPQEIERLAGLILRARGEPLNES